MSKKMRIYMAIMLVAIIFVTLLNNIFTVLETKNIDYNFGNAQKIESLSTNFSDIYIKNDGTMLKRVEYGGIVSEFIVRFVKNIMVYIPLNDAMLSNFSFFDDIVKVNVSFSNIEQVVKIIWKTIGVITTVVLLFICAHEAFLNKKFQELLAILVRARSDVPAINFGVKTIKTIRWP